MGAKSLVRPVTKLYDEDFALWAEETSRLLRHGRFEELDAENLAEEVEDMARSQNRELFSRLTIILQHLLKWRYQPEKRSGSWNATLVTQRAELEQLFEQSPSMKRNLPGVMARAYRIAAAAGAAETGLPEETFPRDCPYSPEQILDETFLPGR